METPRTLCDKTHTLQGQTLIFHLSLYPFSSPFGPLILIYMSSAHHPGNRTHLIGSPPVEGQPHLMPVMPESPLNYHKLLINHKSSHIQSQVAIKWPKHSIISHKSLGGPGPGRRESNVSSKLSRWRGNTSNDRLRTIARTRECHMTK